MNTPLTCEDVARTGLGEPAERQGAELLYRCPHPDGHKNGDVHPSLKINPKKNVWACFPCGASGTAWKLAAFLAGCESGDKERVTAWLKDKGLLNGAKRKAKDGRGPCVASYPYTDAEGKPLARKLRYEPGANGKVKSFSWERWEGERWVSGLDSLEDKIPLYRLPDILNEMLVFVTEGEKDADAGAGIGLPTTTSGGTGTWREDHAEFLRGKDVVILPDADETGRVEAQKRAVCLYGKAASVRVVEIPGSKDLAEAIEKGITREQLFALFQEATEWKPASGPDILNGTMGFIRRFVSLSESQARVATLWLAHTHAIEAAEFTPYLNVNSAEKESGKTRLLEVLKVLAANPWGTENASAAAMVRKIQEGVEAGKPVAVFFDERDSQAGADKERAEAIRGILNSGYQRGGYYSRCVGEGSKITVADFSTFCAKVLAGIGRLTDTVESRSVPIRMKRARHGEVPKFRKHGKEGRKMLGEGAGLKARLAVWCAAHLKALGDAQPEVPDALSDRQADCCDPLLAIADAAGGDWPTAARAALVDLCVGAQADDGSAGVKVLADIRRVLYPHDDDGNTLPEVERIASQDLAAALGAMEARPWAEWGWAQKAISPPQVARLLARFDIAPKTIRLLDGRRLKGYEREQFQESWTVYLPPDSPLHPTSKRDTVTTRINRGENGDFQSVTPDSCHASEKAVSPNNNEPCHGVTLQNQGEGEKRAGEERQGCEVEWEA